MNNNSSLIKKRTLQLREQCGGAISLQDIFDYVDLSIADLRKELSAPQNVKINAVVDEASKAALEKAIADILNTIK